MIYDTTEESDTVTSEIRNIQLSLELSQNENLSRDQQNARQCHVLRTHKLYGPLRIWYLRLFRRLLQA